MRVALLSRFPRADLLVLLLVLLLIWRTAASWGTFDAVLLAPLTFSLALALLLWKASRFRRLVAFLRALAVVSGALFLVAGVTLVGFLGWLLLRGTPAESGEAGIPIALLDIPVGIFIGVLGLALLGMGLRRWSHPSSEVEGP